MKEKQFTVTVTEDDEERIGLKFSLGNPNDLIGKDETFSELGKAFINIQTALGANVDQIVKALEAAEAAHNSEDATK